jgi:cell division septal protein FtsQ
MILQSNSSTIRRKFGRVILSIVLLLASVYVLYVFCMQYFALKNIEVIGEGIQIAIDQAKLERNLLFIRPEKIKADILSDNNQVEHVYITKRYPDTIIIAVQLRKAIARITTITRTVIVDSRGVVLGYSRKESDTLPLLSFGVSDIPDGLTFTDVAVLSGIAVIRDISPVVPISSVYLNDTLSIRAIYGKTSIVFPLNTEYSALASTLQTLVARFRMKGSMPASIDLRFDKPVIRM